MASTGWKEWRKKDVTADAPGEMEEILETDDDLYRALRGGADAVFVARLDANNALVGELANESARLVLGLGADDDAATAEATSPASARPILESMRRAAGRSRATRETLMLPTLDGGQIAVELQLEPLPVTSNGDARVLAVLRANDPTLEAGQIVAPNSSTVGAMRYEHGLGVVFADAALLALLGLAHEHALGHGWLDAVHPDDRTLVARAFEVIDRRPEVLDLEFRLADAGGHERWARLRAAPVGTNEGKATGYLATLEDVTEQRALARSAALLTELTEAIDEWAGLADAGGTLIYANGVARRGLGLHDHDDHRHAKIEPGSLHAGAWTGPIVVLAPDGRRIEIAASLQSHAGPDGTTDHYSFVGRGSSDAQFAAQEVLRLRRAVESTTDLVTFHGRAGRMVFANHAAREVMGLGVDDPLPRVEMHEFFDVTPKQLAEMRGSITENGRWSGELDLRGLHLRIPASVVVTGHRDANGRYEYFSAVSRDITEQRAADAARRRSEAALRAIVQSSPLPIFAVDSGGTVHVWNRACEELFGWTADEAIGSLPRFAAPDEIVELIGRVFTGETVRAHAARYERRDGESLDVNVSVAPLRNAAGRVVSAVLVVADVSDQKRAELALGESEVRFRSLVQNSSDMVMIIADGGRALYRSPSAWRFVGLDPEDDPDASFDEALWAEDRPAVAAMFQRLRQDPGRSETIRFRFLRADGDLRWIEMVATDHRDDPAVGGIVTNARDITHRVEADDAIRASEERLRALVANISDVVSVIGADGAPMYASPTMEQVYGYKDGEWPEGQSIFDIVHPDDRDRVIELWEGARTSRGQFRPLEIRVRRGDGSWMYIEVIANNLLDDPHVNGIVVTSRDITERKAAEAALLGSEALLRESEARYRGVLDDQTELVCRYRPDATLTFVNRAFAEFFGCNNDALAGVKLVDLRPASESPRVLERLQSFSAGDSVRTHIEREVSLDGSLRWYQWTDRAFVDVSGEVVEYQSVGHDITDQRRAAEFTADQAKILEQVARGVPLAQTLTTVAAALEGHFPRFSCAIMLLDPSGSTLRIGAAPTLAPGFLEVLQTASTSPMAGACLAAADLREPVFVRAIATDERWIDHRELAGAHELHAAWSIPIVASDGGAVLGTLNVFVGEPRLPDAEQRQVFNLLAQLASTAIERKAFEETLVHQSMHDPLTGLPNRLLFIDRLGQAIARCRRTKSTVGVAFLDLDRFKNLNDSLGHDAGDELLVEVAERLASVIRPGDTVARFGGDEFTVLCEDLAPDSARELAVEISQRLLATVISPMVVRGTEMFVGASVGIALTASGDELPEELLRDADAALHHAKESGRGRVDVFDDQMRTRVVAAHATENALHRALERGEFRLFYQPIVSLSDARCVGAEALIRWQHPERGLIAPAEFIPLAEETGQIVEMGGWVLEEAARHAARWQLEHPEPFQVAINLSARQLVEPGLADRVTEVMALTGVHPSSLCFEITESVLMDDAETVLDVISRVRSLGVQFAIDDFGTGYSSLGYLKRFSVDSVKIDRSFVSGLGTDPGDKAIVSAVIGLAHALGLRVTAEGVETEEQLLALIDLDCDEAQGYFFSPPQPASDLRGLIARTRTWRPPGAAVMRPAGGVRRSVS
jgi:diguanylate cyclase (GGDEF)-like protein/PAS domain S-box-containing protein